MQNQQRQLTGPAPPPQAMLLLFRNFTWHMGEKKKDEKERKNTRV
jgi:hypothetical protein